VIDASTVKDLQGHWKVKIKVRGVRGYATSITVTDNSFIDGDVLHFDRVLTKREKRAVEKYLLDKMKTRDAVVTTRR
jgi:hypothetical protein